MKRTQYFQAFSYALVLGLSLAGCASGQPRFHAKRAKAVERVALLSFEIRQEQPRAWYETPVLNQSRLSPAGQSPALKQMADEVYKYFTKELARHSSWQVSSWQNVTSNPTYAGAVAARMKILRAAEMPAKESDRVTLIIYPDKILDADAFQTLSYLEKAKIARELGVDAFAALTITQVPSRELARKDGKVSKEDAFSLTSQASLQVFGFDSEDPIWEVPRVSGDSSPNSATVKAEFTPLEQYAELGRQSAILAIQRLLSTYGAK